MDATQEENLSKASIFKIIPTLLMESSSTVPLGPFLVKQINITMDVYSQAQKNSQVIRPALKQGNKDLANSKKVTNSSSWLRQILL